MKRKEFVSKLKNSPRYLFFSPAWYLQEYANLLKYLILIIDGLTLSLILHTILFNYLQNREILFSTNLYIGLFIIPGLLLITHIIDLIKTKNKYQLRKIIGQEFLFSIVFCSFFSSEIYGVETNTINHNLFYWLSYFLISTTTRWRNILPHTKGFKAKITQTEFIFLLSSNIFILYCSMVYEAQGLKTIGIGWLTVIFIGTTFWQSYFLDTKDHLPVIGKYLSKLNKISHSIHKDLSPILKKNHYFFYVDKMKKELLHNPKVGEILKEEFLEEISMSQNALAKAIGVPSNRIHAIVNGTRRVTADTDLRLCRFFCLSEGYFLRLQNAYELMEAKRKLGTVLTEIQPYAS